MLSDTERRGPCTTWKKPPGLGNVEHGKCRIALQDDEGFKAVETTIWTFDPENISSSTV